MKLEDALRKIQLLRRVTRENGFSDGETENAVRLSAMLRRNFSIRPEDLRPPRPAFRRPTWSYWQNLLNEFGLELRHFGKRGSCAIDSTHLVMIRADTAEWNAQRMARSGWEMVERNSGVDALRAYLVRNIPRNYTFHGR